MFFYMSIEFILLTIVVNAAGQRCTHGNYLRILVNSLTFSLKGTYCTEGMYYWCCPSNNEK